ncbi:cation:proton antiporter [Rhodococcus sp. SGAir0479]|uniref:cation:proton antiporter n=1 Tax=Rhodococcus sp. SGAir0479 TaxID=2567884 RepID=UPI0010CCD182|nr:cation:proton antiporter [Rhodococcus sp. SGAir0479]QCQ90975.1 sodium:proton antiporter [Rhodococcus sp. SGAir0479]
MDLTLIAVVGVSSIVAVAAFAKRLGLAAPLLLVVVGIGLSFLPAVPDVDVEPELILAVVLPPLLYSAAVSMPAQDFRRNFKAISGLAVLLVVVTTAGTGALFHLLIPDLGWATAFALGAVVSPTDAVAATSVGRKLGLPSRLLTVLEGEGLVNDASALVLLRSAVAAMAGAVSLWHVAGDFVWSVIAATAIGAVVGVIGVRVRGWVNDTVLNTALSFVVPFVAFVPAEDLGASGVLAVVVCGLVTGHLAPRYLEAEHRIGEEMNWHTVAFLLESAIFLIMGLSLEHLIDEVQDSGLSVGEAVLYGFIASAFVIAARMIFVIPLVAVLKRDERRAAARLPYLERWQDRLGRPGAVEGLSSRRRFHIERRVNRASADADFLLSEKLGWRGGIVLAWSGMRGAITLAAAQTLPADTPYRAELILIAFVVAVTTLLLQGSTLPRVIRWVKIPGDDENRLRSQYDDLLDEMVEAAEEVLAGADDPALVSRVRADGLVGRRADRARAQRDPDNDVRRDEYLRLRLASIAAERRALLDARSSGAYSSSTLLAAQRMLDVEEARLQQLQESTGR